jgi:nitroreductase
METLEAIKRRVSVREYTGEKIGKQLLESLVDAGRRAPTARAIEPWEFIVVTEKEKITRIAQITSPNGSFIKDANACIIILSQDTKYYLEDGCAATENILLTACDFGLGACWVAGDKKHYAGQILEMVGAPARFKLVSIISVGQPRHKAQQMKRRFLKDVIHWEKF